MVALGTFRTKADADRAVTVALVSQSRAAWVDPSRGRQLLGDYAWAWLSERPQLRPRTRELYEGLLRLHIVPALGGVELAKLSPSAVRRWYAGLLRAGHPGPSTVAKSYRLLHAVLATAAADELIVKNPCAITGAGIERAAERKVITVAQVWELADVVDARYRALVLTSAFTGLRRGELFGLTRRRVDLLHRTITVAEQRQQLRHPRRRAAEDGGRCSDRSPSPDLSCPSSKPTWPRTALATPTPFSSPARRAGPSGTTCGRRSG